MPRRYLKAETAVLALPKKIVFVDKKNKKHLLPALTKSHHLATHYGHSAIDLITGKQKFAKLTNKGSLTTAKRIRKVATKKIAEAEKATKEVKKAVVKANTAVATAQKAKRKYTKKKTEAIKAATAVAATAPVVVAAPVAAAKKRGRKPLTAEQKAANKLFRDQKKKKSDDGIPLGFHRTDETRTDGGPTWIYRTTEPTIRTPTTTINGSSGRIYGVLEQNRAANMIQNAIRNRQARNKLNTLFPYEISRSDIELSPLNDYEISRSDDEDKAAIMIQNAIRNKKAYSDYARRIEDKVNRRIEEMKKKDQLYDELIKKYKENKPNVSDVNASIITRSFRKYLQKLRKEKAENLKKKYAIYQPISLLGNITKPEVKSSLEKIEDRQKSLKKVLEDQIVKFVKEKKGSTLVSNKSLGIKLKTEIENMIKKQEEERIRLEEERKILEEEQKLANIKSTEITNQAAKKITKLFNINMMRKKIPKIINKEKSKEIGKELITLNEPLSKISDDIAKGSKKKVNASILIQNAYRNRLAKQQLSSLQQQAKDKQNLQAIEAAKSTLSRAISTRKTREDYISLLQKEQKLAQQEAEKLAQQEAQKLAQQKAQKIEQLKNNNSILIQNAYRNRLAKQQLSLLQQQAKDKKNLQAIEAAKSTLSRAISTRKTREDYISLLQEERKLAQQEAEEKQKSDNFTIAQAALRRVIAQKRYKDYAEIKPEKIVEATPEMRRKLFMSLKQIKDEKELNRMINANQYTSKMIDELTASSVENFVKKDREQFIDKFLEDIDKKKKSSVLGSIGKGLGSLVFSKPTPEKKEKQAREEASKILSNLLAERVKVQKEYENAVRLKKEYDASEVIVSSLLRTLQGPKAYEDALQSKLVDEENERVRQETLAKLDEENKRLYQSELDNELYLQQISKTAEEERIKQETEDDKIPYTIDEILSMSYDNIVKLRRKYIDEYDYTDHMHQLTPKQRLIYQRYKEGKTSSEPQSKAKETSKVKKGPVIKSEYTNEELDNMSDEDFIILYNIAFPPGQKVATNETRGHQDIYNAYKRRETKAKNAKQKAEIMDEIQKLAKAEQRKFKEFKDSYDYVDSFSDKEEKRRVIKDLEEELEIYNENLVKTQAEYEKIKAQNDANSKFYRDKIKKQYELEVEIATIEQQNKFYKSLINKYKKIKV